MLWILIIVALLIAASGPWTPYGSGWGYGPSGLLTAVLVVLIILLLTGRLRI